MDVVFLYRELGGTKMTRVVCDQYVIGRLFYLCTTLAVFETPFRVATSS